MSAVHINDDKAKRRPKSRAFFQHESSFGFGYLCRVIFDAWIHSFRYSSSTLTHIHKSSCPQRE